MGFAHATVFFEGIKASSLKRCIRWDDGVTNRFEVIGEYHCKEPNISVLQLRMAVSNKHQTY